MSDLSLVRRIVAFGAVVVLSAAVLFSTTSCSSPDADKGKTDDSAVVTYKIGVGVPLTQGATAVGQGLARSAQLAVRDANASKEAKDLGIAFEVTLGDDLSDPKTGVTVANFFAGDPRVIGVMGHLNSGVCIPASQVYADAGLVMVAPAATSPELTLQGLDNVFRVCTIDTVQGSFAAESAVEKLGLKSAFIVDDSTPYGDGLAAEFAKAFEVEGGKIVGHEKTSDKDTEFAALATKIKAANPDVVYYGGVYTSGALLAKQIRDTGSKAVFFSGDAMNDAQFVKLAGAKAAEGAFATTVGLPLDKLEKGAEFKSAYAEKFPGEQMSAFDAYGYDATQVITAAALRAAARLGADKLGTPEGRKAVIEEVSITDHEGLTGHVAFDEKGDTLNKMITLYTVKDGAWTAF